MDEDHEALARGDIFTLERVRRTRGFSTLHGINIDEAASRGQLSILKLLSENAAATFTTQAIDQAAAHGHLDVVQYLRGMHHAPCTTDAMDAAAENGHWDVVTYLLTTREDEWELVDTTLDHAAQTTLWTARVMDAAALDGRLDLVRQFHRHGLSCSPWAMDYAAACGHFEVVKFLHTHRREGCTTRAMDEAAKSRHFDTVHFLHMNRTEGCTTAAMDHAAANGDLEMVTFLHTNRSEGCTTDAIDAAAANGHVAVVQFLLRHRNEGFTCHAVESAAKPGCEKRFRSALFRSESAKLVGDHRHVQILRMLFHARPDLFDPHILTALLLCGAFDLWLELKPALSALPNGATDPWAAFPEDGGEEAAMMLAGERGHLSTIRFLREVQGRRDLLQLAFAGAAHERPSWLTAMYRDDPESAYNYTLFHAADDATALVLCEPWCPQSFFLEDGIPDWMREQALIDHELTQQHLKGDEYPCHWTWPIWAIYRDDLVALEIIRTLEASADYMCDPRFSFDDARSHAVRVGSLDLLQWLFEKIPHVAVEPTLLDDAIFYGRLEIAKWLAHHQPDACVGFPGATAWPLAPLGVRLSTKLLDELERDARLRVLVDFGAMAAYAAEQSNLLLLQRLFTRYPASVLARRDLVDRVVLLNGGCCDLSVLRYLQEIGYTHASPIAMDSVTSDSQLAVLEFLYKHYRQGDSTLRGIMDAARNSSWKIVLYHLEHRGLTDSERDALQETVAANADEDWAATLGYVLQSQQEKEERELNAEWLSDSDM